MKAFSLPNCYVDDPSDNGNHEKIRHEFSENYAEAKFSIIAKSENVINITPESGKKGVYTERLTSCVCLALAQFNEEGAASRVAAFHIPGGIGGLKLPQENAQTIVRKMCDGFYPNQQLNIFIAYGIDNKEEYLSSNRLDNIIHALKENGFHNLKIEEQLGQTCFAIAFHPNTIGDFFEAIKSFSLKP